MQDLTSAYKKITNAGRLSFWVGVVELIVVPVAAWLPYIDPTQAADSSGTKLAGAIIGALYQAAIGILLIIFGRRMKAASPDTTGSVDRAEKARIVLLVTVAVTIVLNILGGGGAGLLVILLILNLVWAAKAVKDVRAAATSSVAAPTTPADAATPLT